MELGLNGSQTNVSGMDVVTIPKKEYLALKKKAKELDSIKTEKELVSKKLDNIDRKIKSGKRKLLTAEQALGPYAKQVK